jgi:ADP-ribose pyrophosphatase YjhB (NUDIX family)
MSKRLDFPNDLPLTHTKYCFYCGATTIKKINEYHKEGPRTLFICSTCDKKSNRVRIWDKNMIQYFDEKNNLVHEGAGTVVQNELGDILLFLRTKYPFLWTIPGGHMSPHEDSKAAALRELEEETGIKLQNAQLIFEGIIDGDECMGGCDIHMWHLYLTKTKDTHIFLDEEGSQFAWFPVTSIPENITFPVKYLLEQKKVQESLKTVS